MSNQIYNIGSDVKNVSEETALCSPILPSEKTESDMSYQSFSLSNNIELRAGGGTDPGGDPGGTPIPLMDSLGTLLLMSGVYISLLFLKRKRNKLRFQKVLNFK